jgi:tetratricopeptide (TPR) repeat protein
VDCRDLKDRASKLQAAGKLQKALEVYRQVLAAEPKDPQTRIRYAEICRRAGALDEAVEAYLQAAELLAAAGHAQRAHAALKLALQVTPDDPRLRSALERVAVAAATSPGQSFQREAATRVGQIASPRGPLVRSVSLEMEVVEIPLQAAPAGAHVQVRRLAANAVAVQVGAEGKWVVVTSPSPIAFELRDELPGRTAEAGRKSAA